MPVYLRKNVVFTPPSIENISDEDDDDFIQNPEQIRDLLPQPYRMINKILSQLVDDSWNILAEKENARIAEQSKVRPPKYECAVETQNQLQSNVTALADSVDGRYVFIGLPTGLAVMDATTQKHITIWEEDNMEITSMKSYIVGVQTYLIVTIDDMGTARLFAFAFDCLLMLKVLNEQEGGTKNLVTKCESSAEGDYVGIVFENTSLKETWLEIHRLPRDAWLRELEAIQTQLAAKQKALTESGDPANTDGQGVNEGETTQLPDSQPKQTTKGWEKSRAASWSGDSRRSSASSDKHRRRKRSETRKGTSKDRAGSPKPSTPPLLTGLPGEKIHYKFTSPNLVLKVKPPQPYTANTNPTVYAACQKVDSGEVVGSGLSHLLTASHLEGRDAMFDHLHENLIRYLPKKNNDVEKTIMPTFHFLTAGVMVPVGLEQPAQSGLPTTVAVWWNGGTHIMHYSLLKTAKDFEHKPDLVWPFCSNIEYTDVTSCCVLMAVGLQNGTVVLWDRYLGINKGVLRIPSKCSIKYLKFLDPSIAPVSSDSFLPYRKSTVISLLIQCDHGEQFIYTTADAPNDVPVCITEAPDKYEEEETILQFMSDVPELVLVSQHNGSLFLKDVTTGSNICQMTLPPSHQIPNTWDPVVAFGAGGQFLYVKGTKIVDPNDLEEEDTFRDPNSQSALFMYQLRSFPTLDPYWKRERTSAQYLVHTTLDERIDALMKERLAQQALRKTRMQSRWGMLRQELDIIQQARDVAKRRADERRILSASTYKSSGSILPN